MQKNTGGGKEQEQAGRRLFEQFRQEVMHVGPRAKAVGWGSQGTDQRHARKKQNGGPADLTESLLCLGYVSAWHSRLSTICPNYFSILSLNMSHASFSPAGLDYASLSRHNLYFSTYSPYLPMYKSDPSLKAQLKRHLFHSTFLTLLQPELTSPPLFSHSTLYNLWSGTHAILYAPSIVLYCPQNQVQKPWHGIQAFHKNSNYLCISLFTTKL